MFMFEFRLFVCWFNFFACLTFLSYLPVLEKFFNSVLKIVLFWYRETWNIASFMRCRKIIEFSEKIWTSHIWIWSLDALSFYSFQMRHLLHTMLRLTLSKASFVVLKKNDEKFSNCFLNYKKLWNFSHGIEDGKSADFWRILKPKCSYVISRSDALPAEQRRV